MKVTSNKITKNTLAPCTEDGLQEVKDVKIYDNGWKSINLIKGYDIYNETLDTVWERVEYSLEANDSFTMPPNGGIVESNLSIISRLNKPDGTHDWVEYTVNPSNISANTGTTSKEHEIVITQKTSNLQITATCIQDNDTYYGIVYETPVVTSVTAATAEAVGEDVMLTVRYTQKVIRQYASGNKEEIISGTINPTIDSGSAKVSNVTRNGKYIKVPSAGTIKYTSDRTVYTVTGYSFTVNGKTKIVTGVNIDVKQEANIVEYTTATDGSLSISAYPETVPAANHGSKITVTCYKNVRDVYTSGAYGDPVRENAEATLTSSTGTFYPHSSIMGGSTTMFSPYENSTNQKVTHIVNASVRIGSNTYTDSCTIVQDPPSYEFAISSNYISFPYNGGETKIEITNKKNGGMNSEPSIINTNSSFLTDISLSEEDNYVWILTVSAGSNPNTSARRGTITVTQQGSNQQLNISVGQEGQPSSGGEGEDTSNTSVEFTSVRYAGTRIDFEGIVTTDKSYVDGLIVQVENSKWGGGTVYGEPIEFDVRFNGDGINGSIELGDYFYGLYIVAYYNNNVIGSKLIE